MHPLVRAQQVAEQPPRAGLQQAGLDLRQVVRAVLGGDAAPVAVVVGCRRSRSGRSVPARLVETSLMRRTSSSLGVGREQLAVGRHRGQQLAVVARRG